MRKAIAFIVIAMIFIAGCDSSEKIGSESSVEKSNGSEIGSML